MSTAIRSIRLGVLIALLAAPTIFAQEQGKSTAHEQPGLKVGETAPRFTLRDQEGSDRSLNEFLQKGPVALVFYRSADW